MGNAERIAMRRAFIDAADEGDVAAIDALLAGGLDPNATLFLGRTNRAIEGSRAAGGLPLRHAVRGGHLAVVQRLLEAGAVPDVPDSQGWTALTEADELGHDALAERLLASGADPAARNIHGTTPLHRAARSGDLAALDALLEGGHPIEARDRVGTTPLHAAVARGELAAAKRLIAVGANPSAADDHGWTVLHSACYSGGPEVVRLLLATGHVDIDALDKEGWPPLFETVRQVNQDFDAFRLLVEAGADLTISTDQGTVMHHIAEFGDARYVAKALDAGAEREPLDHDGRSPVHVAVLMGNASVLRALIAAGAATESLDNDGSSPRHLVESDPIPEAPEVVAEILEILQS